MDQETSLETSSLLMGSSSFVERDDMFSNIKQEILPRISFDHTPIVLQLVDGSTPNLTSSSKVGGWKLNFLVIRVKIWWTSFVIEGKPNYILAAKLKALKGKLKEWSSSTYVNLEMGKILILNQITELDNIQQQRCLNKEEVTRKEDLLCNLQITQKRKK